MAGSEDNPENAKKNSPNYFWIKLLVSLNVEGVEKSLNCSHLVALQKCHVLVLVAVSPYSGQYFRKLLRLPATQISTMFIPKRGNTQPPKK